jgi:hypothetical protein
MPSKASPLLYDLFVQTLRDGNRQFLRGPAHSRRDECAKRPSLRRAAATWKKNSAKQRLNDGAF